MVRSLVKESQPFLFGVDMLQAVSMNWEFDFDVFSKWKDGNYLAYGVNGNGSDWLGEIILRDGKFYKKRAEKNVWSLAKHMNLLNIFY